MKNDSMFIPEGMYFVARGLFRSEIWRRHPLYLKLWLWLIGKANHSDQTKNGYKYRRGEVITTYSEIIEALGYRGKGNKNELPSIKKVRNMLGWFEKREMIVKKPLTSFNPQITSVNQMGHKGADLGAYVGLRITILNYDIYQNAENYRGRPKGTPRGRPGAEVGHDNNNDNNDNNDINYVPYDEIVSYLNQLTGKNFRHNTRATKDRIRARWNEGFRLEEFKRVIDNKTAEWKGDPAWDKYLRPETLFNTKFESYLNQREIRKPKLTETIPEV